MKFRPRKIFKYEIAIQTYLMILLPKSRKSKERSWVKILREGQGDLDSWVKWREKKQSMENQYLIFIRMEKVIWKIQ